METKIKNKDSILCEGDVDSKRIVLNIAEKTLQKLDAYERIKSITKYENKMGSEQKEPCISDRSRKSM